MRHPREIGSCGTRASRPKAVPACREHGIRGPSEGAAARAFEHALTVHSRGSTPRAMRAPARKTSRSRPYPPRRWWCRRSTRHSRIRPARSAAAQQLAQANRPLCTSILFNEQARALWAAINQDEQPRFSDIFGVMITSIAGPTQRCAPYLSSRASPRTWALK